MLHPLYKDCAPCKQLDSHAGLWFERFFNKYNPDWTVPKDDSGKLAWIKEVVGIVGGKAVDAAALRQRELIKALGGVHLVAKTDWHFATGLGNNHPVENGFAWHPTLGVPYLTGAAVKGLLRAWCEQWAGFDAVTLRLWFGPSLDELKAKQTPAAGALIFFDAIPTGPVKLKADVMTPHLGDWYEDGGDQKKQNGKVVPADWHSPNPVPFLVVDQGQSFQFSVAKRATAAASPIQLDEVKKQLLDALQQLGAGAKTAVGYGRMRRDIQAETKLAADAEKFRLDAQTLEGKAKAVSEKAVRQANMTPLERELDDWCSLTPAEAEAQTKSWVERAFKVPKSGQHLIAKALKTFYQTAKTWDTRGSKKHNEKINKIKEMLL